MLFWDSELNENSYFRNAFNAFFFLWQLCKLAWIPYVPELFLS